MNFRVRPEENPTWTELQTVGALFRADHHARAVIVVIHALPSRQSPPPESGGLRSAGAR